MPKERWRPIWEEFSRWLKEGHRYDDFSVAYEAIDKRICGFYRIEIEHMWKNLENENIQTMAEVGRNLGGGLYMLMSACKNIKQVLSVDVLPIPEVDIGLLKWCNSNNIDLTLIQSDSKNYIPSWNSVDFVYIDGGHDYDSVKSDIENWKNKTRLIGFHDYADKRKNKHKKVFDGVIQAINEGIKSEGWEQVGERGRSEILFKTKYYEERK
jgi:hypothetical protein